VRHTADNEAFASQPRHRHLGRECERTLMELGLRGFRQQPVGSTLTALPASSRYTPAERAGLFLKAEGEPQ